MSLHSDLLAQARYLVSREPRRPKQASLRRAVSAAYYAVFHLLTSEASKGFAKDDGLQAIINRAFTHREMNTVSKAFAGGHVPKKLDSVTGRIPVPPQLSGVAQAFADLQQARHEADYNLAKSFTRSEALALISQADQAFRDWATVRKTDWARVYLACFMLWDKWEK